MTSCVAFATVPANLTIRRLSTFSTSSESSVSWKDPPLDPLDSINPLTPLTPEIALTPLRSRSSTVSKIKTKSICKCGKCPVWCWLERIYRNVSGKSLAKHENCKRCTRKAAARAKLKGLSSASVSSTVRCDDFAMDNLSWDASADFLESFQGTVPYRTLKMTTSTPKKNDWIDEDEEYDVETSVNNLSEDDDESYSLISWNQSEPKIVPVIIKGRDIPDARLRVQTTRLYETPTPTPPPPLKSVSALALNHNYNANPSIKLATGQQHRRLERLKEDVAEVRAQIEEALRLCKQVEVELKDIKSTSSTDHIDMWPPKASWIKSNQRWTSGQLRSGNSSQSGGLILNGRPPSVVKSFLQSDLLRVKHFGVGGGGTTRVNINTSALNDDKRFYHCPAEPILFQNQNGGPGCHVCCGEIFNKSKWDKTFVEHRVFVEEMKYHFRWQQGMAH